MGIQVSRLQPACTVPSDQRSRTRMPVNTRLFIFLCFRSFPRQHWQRGGAGSRDAWGAYPRARPFVIPASRSPNKLFCDSTGQSLKMPHSSSPVVGLSGLPSSSRTLQSTSDPGVTSTRPLRWPFPLMSLVRRPEGDKIQHGIGAS